METLELSGHLSPGWSQILIVIGAIAAVTVIIFLWAVVFHKRGVKQRRRRRHSRSKPGNNPTLAETGGLPPIRDNDDSLRP